MILDMLSYAFEVICNIIMLTKQIDSFTVLFFLNLYTKYEATPSKR